MSNSVKTGLSRIWKSYHPAFLISLILLCLGFYSGVRSSTNDRYLARNGSPVVAVVSDSQFRAITIKIGYWQNKLDYQVNGVTHSLFESSFLSRNKGEIVTVIFDPKNPENARINDSWPSGWMGYFIGLVGLIPSLFFVIAEILGYIASRL